MTDSVRLVELRFPSRSDRLRMVREVVRQAGSITGIHVDETERMVIAVNEACMNVIQHAYGSDAGGDIVLDVLLGDSSLEFRLIDFAEQIEDRSCIKSRDLDDIRPGGLGVHMISEVMDEVSYQDGPDGIGNMLIMKKSLELSPGRKS